MFNTDDAHLARLRDHFARDGVLPSYADMGRMLGFASKGASFKLARRLTEQGFLRKGPGGRLVPTERFMGIPLATDSVRAGCPQAGSGTVEAELVTLDGYLIDAPSSTILVRVKGDSMVEAGILDGDLAVVNRGLNANPGDIVVADIDGELTVKELQYSGSVPFLQPRHPRMEAIRPEVPWQVVGVVSGIVRRLVRERKHARAGYRRGERTK